MSDINFSWVGTLQGLGRAEEYPKGGGQAAKRAGPGTWQEATEQVVHFKKIYRELEFPQSLSLMHCSHLN